MNWNDLIVFNELPKPTLAGPTLRHLCRAATGRTHTEMEIGLEIFAILNG